MATLEKIRSKSVLLFIIIIVALLAFILGDFLNSGQTYFGNGTTVAKAGGVSVQYNDYQNRINELSNRYRNQGNVSSDAISSQALSELIAEGLLNKEFKDLGIVVTDSELSEAMFGVNQHPMAAQTIAQLSQALRLDAPDAANVHDAIANPVRYGITDADAAQIAQIWTNTEKEIENQMLQQKFGRLMSGLFTYNNLDAQSIYNDVATTRHISYAVKDASSVANDEIEFSDADVERLWDSRRNEYALDEETRFVEYIYVKIEPDRQDRIDADNTVENALLGLNETEGLDAISSDSRFVIENGNAPASAINNRALRSFLDTAAVGQAVVLERVTDRFTLAKLMGKSSGIDSINVSFARPSTIDASVDLDSIAAAINAGSKVSELTADGTLVGADSLWQSLIVPGMPQELLEALTSATVGNAFVYNDSINGSGVFKVNSRHAPVTVYDFATANFTVDPSQRTLDSLSVSLRTFVSNNSSAAEFSANAAENGYPTLTDEVSASSVMLGNAADSRKFVKWVMDADKGKVSPVFQDDKQTYLLAVAVKDIYSDYRPFNSPSIYAMLQGEARDAKKAAHLMEQYNGQGTDVASYAQAMGVEVSEGDVNITRPILMNIGINESALSGAIAAAGEGEFVGPVQGKHGIMVFQVASINSENRPFTAEEYGQLFLRSFMPQRNPQLMLLGKNKIDNLSLNFIANPAE